MSLARLLCFLICPRQTYVAVGFLARWHREDEPEASWSKKYSNKACKSVFWPVNNAHCTESINHFGCALQ